MLSAYLPFFDAAFPVDWEMIVSVNGSRDDTEAVVRSFQPAHPALRVIVTPDPIGKGGAIMAATPLARGRVVGFVDADGATPPDAFLDLVRSVRGDELVIASRYVPGARVSPPQPLRRRIASRIFNALVRTLFKLRIHDTQCGAKAMSADAWHAVVPKIGLTKWAFDVDMLFKTRRLRFPIREIPTTWHDIGGSQLRLGPVSFQMFLAICRLRLLYSSFSFVVALYDRLLGRAIRLSPYTE
jgi:glycosyltransferase involved in cell wall biosynthesis